MQKVEGQVTFFFDDREQSGKGASSSENESESEGSWEKLSDKRENFERNLHVTKIFNFHFILA